MEITGYVGIEVPPQRRIAAGPSARDLRDQTPHSGAAADPALAASDSEVR
jgi:hypothetical protein